MKITHVCDCAQKRREAYPTIPEQIGAIWKILHAMQMGETTPEDAIKIQDSIDLVKAKYPRS